MKAVQIGIGGWGKNHARILAQLNALVAVCDVDANKTNQYAKQYSVNHYCTISELLEKENFDVAFVCTPTFTHFDIANELLKNKKHVFVEKPLTTDPKYAKILQETAKQNNVLLSCGYLERFNPAVQKLKEIIISNKYGSPLMMEFHRENKKPPHINDVGIIFDTMVHDIDMAVWLFDQKPNVVYARSGKLNHDHEVYSSIVLGFDNDKTAVISANWLSPAKFRTFNTTFEDVVINTDYLTQQISIQEPDQTQIPKTLKIDILHAEIKSFLDAAAGKSELIVKSQHAVITTQIAQTAIISAQKGVPIYLEL